MKNQPNSSADGDRSRLSARDDQDNTPVSTTRSISQLAQSVLLQISHDPSKLPAASDDELAVAAGIGHRARLEKVLPDRLAEIQLRIAAGFYSDKQIQQKIADRLADTISRELPDGEG